jgi:diaminopimelate decarboxylase
MKASPYSLAILLALASSIDAFAPTRKPHHAVSSSSSSSSLLLRAVSPAADAIVPSASSNFLTPELAQSCIEIASGTPLYAYSLTALSESANDCLAFPNAYGLTVRYAMKACPNGTVLRYFLSRGINIDASSGYEVRRAMDMGVPPEKISLSSQELPSDFAELVELGVKVNAW